MFVKIHKINYGYFLIFSVQVFQVNDCYSINTYKYY